MSWKDDPVERHYEAQIDRSAAGRAHQEDMRRIRTDSDLCLLNSRIEFLRSAEKRARLSQDVKDEGDALEGRFRECQWFSERACERWAHQAWTIARCAEDDLAATERLSAEFLAAAAEFQQNLKAIIEALGVKATNPSRPGDPPLVRLHRARTAAWSQVGLVTIRIGACEHLRADTKQRWLNALPSRESSLEMLRYQQPCLDAGLRGEVARRLESVKQFTFRVRNSLQFMKSLIELRDLG
jgi:hypothetical protein